MIRNVEEAKEEDYLGCVSREGLSGCWPSISIRATLYSEAKHFPVMTTIIFSLEDSLVAQLNKVSTGLISDWIFLLNMDSKTFGPCSLPPIIVELLESEATPLSYPQDVPSSANISQRLLLSYLKFIGAWERFTSICKVKQIRISIRPLLIFQTCQYLNTFLLKLSILCYFFDSISVV